MPIGLHSRGSHAPPAAVGYGRRCTAATTAVAHSTGRRHPSTATARNHAGGRHSHTAATAEERAHPGAHASIAPPYLDRRPLAARWPGLRLGARPLDAAAARARCMGNPALGAPCRRLRVYRGFLALTASPAAALGLYPDPCTIEVRGLGNGETFKDVQGARTSGRSIEPLHHHRASLVAFRLQLAVRSIHLEVWNRTHLVLLRHR